MPDGVRTCRTCGEPIRWATMLPSGKAHPFDAEPVPNGAYVHIPGPDGTKAKFVPKQDRSGMVLHDSHFATCSDAQKWRRPDQ